MGFNKIIVEPNGRRRYRRFNSKAKVTRVLTMILDRCHSRSFIMKSCRVTDDFMKRIEERVKPIHFQDFFIIKRAAKFELETYQRKDACWELSNVEKAETLEDCRNLLPKGVEQIKSLVVGLKSDGKEWIENWAAPDPDIKGLYWEE